MHATLRGRRRECEVLDDLLASVRTGENRALVLRGEAGIGKTALLEHLAGSASGFRVARAVGVESEMELAHAGLHQLCAPFVDRIDPLPGPQRDALSTAFGRRAGDAPNRFLVGLAVLGLLSDAVEEEPLLWIVDDAQWLDESSSQTLAFVARRLGAESVAMVVALRDGAHVDDFVGLDELVIRGLDEGDAHALLGTVPSMTTMRLSGSRSSRNSALASGTTGSLRPLMIVTGVAICGRYKRKCTLPAGSPLPRAGVAELGVAALVRPGARPRSRPGRSAWGADQGVDQGIPGRDARAAAPTSCVPRTVSKGDSSWVRPIR